MSFNIFKHKKEMAEIDNDVEYFQGLAGTENDLAISYQLLLILNMKSNIFVIHVTSSSPI